MKHPVIASLLVAFGISLVAYAADAPAGLTDKQVEMREGNYVPGMGEIMGATQMRHSKLWFVGQARNWNLASNELDEIKEGLEDALKYHPVFKKDAPIAAMLDKFMAQPLNDLGSAIKAKDSMKFRKSFDSLTRGCNGCHEAAGQGFIIIRRPYSLFGHCMTSSPSILLTSCHSKIAYGCDKVATCIGSDPAIVALPCVA